MIVQVLLHVEEHLNVAHSPIWKINSHPRNKSKFLKF